MRLFWARIWIAGCAAAAIPVQLAGGSQIAPGVTYTLHDAPGPNKVFVVAMDRLQTDNRLKVGWAEKRRMFTATQTTSTIAGLYHDPAGNHQVVAAMNGSFFGSPPDIVGWPVASDGEILQQPNAQNDTFMFGPARLGVVRAEIANQTGTLTFANGNTLDIDQYNLPQAINSVTAYTPQYDTTTGSTAQGVEVIIEHVTYPMRSGKEVAGTVTAIKTGGASLDNAIPAGGMVINAYGFNAATAVYNNTQVGDRLRMRFRTGSEAMNNADMAITGIGWIISNGQPNTANWANRPGGFPYSRHPRTVLASSPTHVFLVVCDGRQSPTSVGMTFQEMATFLTGTLGATEAINLDGGGSSTMVVNGAVVNKPSDGAERRVANAVMVVREATAGTFVPFFDPFAATGRKWGWDDKFAYNAVVPFSPSAPGGDGHVLRVLENAGGVQTVRRGDLRDADYTVEADIYCEYRPDVAGDGFERYGIFARDSGTGAFGLSTFGGGNCYALLCDSDTGRIRAGRYDNGSFTDFLAAPIYSPVSAWQRFRIDCAGPQIRYYVNDELLVGVTDTAIASGYYGIGYHSFFTTPANMRGTRADLFRAFQGEPPIPGDFDGDGDVDQEDFGHLQRCFSGTAVPQTDPDCLDADLDGDLDVDQADFQIFFRCVSGPNIPGDPDCVAG